MTLPSLWLSIALLQTASPALAPQATGDTCQIRGRITDKETGLPVPGAVVRLNTVGGKTALTTRADEEGLYQFTNLAPGQYMGLVEAGEFRASHVGAPLVPRPLLLKSGEVRSDVNVALERGRAITVRVVDDEGEPLAGVRISVTSANSGYDFNPGWRRLTDDRGRLRIFKLPPGRYIACAEPGMGSFAANSGPVRRERLLRTCFPSAATAAQGEPVRLEQSDIEDLEIRMRRGRTFTITGTVLDSLGAVASDAVVSFNRFERNSSSGTGVAVKNGRFSIANVAPGEYAIEASIGGTERPEHRRDREEALVPVHIDSADVTDMVVTMAKAVVVAGRVTLEEPMPNLPRDPGYGPMLVYARMAGDRLPGLGGARSAAVGDDRVFYLDRMFGRRKLEVLNVPRGWYVKSIQYEGKEITHTPAEFTGSRDPSRLEIILSSRGAVVTGRVVDERGEPAPGARVILFPANPELWEMRQVAGINVAATGTFKLGPQPAGEYLVIAFYTSEQPAGLNDRERLTRLALDAERVTLRENEERTLDLRVLKSAR